MKPCIAKRKDLALLAVGALDARQAQGLRSHIQTCEGCRRYLEDISALGERLGAAGSSPVSEAPESFHREWLGRLQAEPSVSPWQALVERLHWRWALPAMGAVAVLLALLAALLPRQPAALPQMHAERAPAMQPATGRDLSPSLANYQRVAVRSLDEFDELLSAQADRKLPSARIYTASIFAAAHVPN